MSANIKTQGFWVFQFLSIFWFCLPNWRSWGFALLVFFVFGLAETATARDLYVTSEVEARAALSRANPGDHIVIRNGSYTNWQLILRRSGTERSPIILRAETPGGVQFTGDTRITIAADHTVVTGFTFDSVPGHRDGMQVVRFTNARYSELRDNLFIRSGAHRFRHVVLIDSGSDDNLVRHNKFVASIGQGVGISGRGVPALRNTISQNHFDGITDDGENNGQEPIQLGQQTYNEHNYSALVEFNLIENMRGDADPEMISVKIRGAHIRQNVFLHDGEGGVREIVLRSAADTVVEKNLLIGAGIRVFGPNHVIRGNQIIGNAGHPFHGIRLPRWPRTYPDTDGAHIDANVLIDTTRSCIDVGRMRDNGNVNEVREVTVRGNVCHSDRGYLYGLSEGHDSVSFESNVAWGRARHVNGPITGGVQREDPDLEHMAPFWLRSTQKGETWRQLLNMPVGPSWHQTTIGERVGLVGFGVVTSSSESDRVPLR